MKQKKKKSKVQKKKSREKIIIKEIKEKLKDVRPETTEPVEIFDIKRKAPVLERITEDSPTIVTPSINVGEEKKEGTTKYTSPASNENLYATKRQGETQEQTKQMTEPVTRQPERIEIETIGRSFNIAPKPLHFRTELQEMVENKTEEYNLQKFERLEENTDTRPFQQKERKYKPFH